MLPELEFAIYYGDEIVLCNGRDRHEAWLKVDLARYPNVTPYDLKWIGWKNGYSYQSN